LFLIINYLILLWCKIFTWLDALAGREDDAGFTSVTAGGSLA